MVSLTVFYTLIVIHLISATSAQWISCLNGCDQIKNIQFTDKVSAVSESGQLDTSISQINPNDKIIWFTLKSSSYNSSDQTVSIEFSQTSSYVLFTCSLLVTVKIGPNYKETTTHYSIYPEINGTAIYIKDKLYCSWSIKIMNSTIPYELIDPPKYLISKSGYQILYNLNQTVRVPSADYSQLPESVEPFVDGYEYKAVGSQKYLLISRIGNQSTDFLLKVNEEIPKSVEVRLKSEIEMDIECNFEKQQVFGYINYVEKAIDWSLLKETEINDDECRWSLPNLIDSEYGLLRPKQMVNGMQIVENKKWVYFDENNFRIGTVPSGSSSLVIPKSLLIATIFSLIFV